MFYEDELAEARRGVEVPRREIERSRKLDGIRPRDAVGWRLKAMRSA